MSILDCLGSILPKTEIELTRSLPVCNNDKEFLFFFGVTEGAKGQPVFEQIFHFFVYDKATKQLQEENPEKYISKDLYSKLQGSIIEDPAIEPFEDMDLTSSLYDVYRQIAEISLISKTDKKQNELLLKYGRLFNQLQPDCILKKVYMELGKTMFDFIALL